MSIRMNRLLDVFASVAIVVMGLALAGAPPRGGAKDPNSMPKSLAAPRRVARPGDAASLS
jgi:hypothetical protein